VPECPLYSQKRTCAVQLARSALGQYRNQELASEKRNPILHTECGVACVAPPMDLWGRNHGQDRVKPQTANQQLVLFLSEPRQAP
jgi:hypothetical protein